MVRFLAVVLVGALTLISPAAPARADFAQRIATAEEYLSTRPGTVGYVLRDRSTGLVHRNQSAGALIWTASTIKLAMVVDLLTRATAGQITLTNADRQLMAAMMHSSDNDAAATLWKRFGGVDHEAFNRNFPSYGMTGLQPQQGFSDVYPDWGFQKSSTDDLDRLMNYALGRLPAAQTEAIVSEMQGVDANQQWGVWGAGTAMQPGNKNGWSLEQGGWVVNSVGFAGPGQRYTLAIMNSLEGEGGFEEGKATTTRLAEILLGPG
ncbi:tat pathway signal sequence [Mycobacterium sp. MS1601]|uniref:serine hydrolase n=1 Tax=Mycobacterium sp. MS1601 TaxID=1936029 RepID=UPI0009793450|nr:serine hydrolase [Mycobacterium sp. MS1601]AQA03286.1 tat pathway signal sequence [Mycobacterium sp. MS1601]